jgi:ubiquinone/menaquinone biosynthesis C-methylase UbiE
MSSELNTIRDNQKSSWDKFSPGWKKWDQLTMDFIQPQGDALINSLKPTGNDFCLDIASGTGEPGITIASLLSTGKVIVTDLSDGMLSVAKEKVESMGIKNLETQIVDACALPFDDNTFDVVSCRLGFMFFPDMQLAAKEMARVLKPGGRLATTVWSNPTNNFWVTTMVKNISKHVEMPAPVPGAPGMFRCAAPGLMAGLFGEAGLSNISEKVITGKMNLKSGDEYWDFMTDIAAPFVAALSGADEKTVEIIRQDVINSVNEKYPNADIDTEATIIYGTKTV